jgi:hypothetical protein
MMISLNSSIAFQVPNKIGQRFFSAIIGDFYKKHKVPITLSYLAFLV